MPSAHNIIFDHNRNEMRCMVEVNAALLIYTHFLILNDPTSDTICKCFGGFYIVFL